MKRILLLSFVLLGLVTSAWAQRTVSGQVTADREPLPGVAVRIKGTSQGTVTDMDGNYRIEVPGNNTVLNFSFIGYAEREVTVGNRTVIDVTLSEDIEQLTEVVVTAVGIEREQKSLGYAVSRLDPEDIAQKSEPDPIRALTGKIPGVNITGSGGLAGGSTNITIRGNSSLLGNNQPLFVVDGVPFDNSANASTSFIGGNQSSNRAVDLDPNNIASLTVLKGAAASILYGSRAANGVIVITTKAGSKGVRKGLEVTLNNSYSWEKPANLPEYQSTYGQGAEFAYNGGFVGTWGSRYDEDEDGLIPHPYWQPGNGGLPGIFPNLVGEMVPYRFHDNLNNFFGTGHVLENSLQITSGVGAANITAGVGRSNNESFIPGSSFERISVNFGGNAQLENGLFISGNVNYVRSTQQAPPVGISADYTASSVSIFTRLLFTPPSFDLMGNPYQNPVTGGNVYFRTDQDNPRWLVDNAPYTSNVDRTFGNFTLAYDILDNLQVSYKAGFNSWTDDRRSVLAKGSYVTPGGSMYTDNYSFEELNGDLLISYTTELNPDFSLRTNIGHNLNQRTTTREAFNASNAILFGLDRFTNTVNQTYGSDTYTRRRLMGVFGDLTVGYKDYAFVTLAGRNDWSSTLPQVNRSFFYPSISGSFVFSDAFGLTGNTLSNGKLRAGYSVVGNDAGVYQTANVLILNQNFGFNRTDIGFPFRDRANISVSNTAGNPALVAEKTAEWEVGMELGLFQNRIGIDAAYYNRTSTDQITSAAVAPSAGISTRVINAGEVLNHGVEIGLNLVPVRLANGFEWSIYSAFTRNISEIKDTGDSDLLIAGGFSNGISVVHIAGRPYGQLYGTEPIRRADGQYLVNPLTGLLTESNYLTVIGDPNPDFVLGTTNTFSFKGLSLSALIEWRQGGDLYSNQVANMIGRGVHKITEDREWSRVIPGVSVEPATAQLYGQAMQDMSNGTAMSDLTEAQREAIETVNAAPSNNMQVTANQVFFSDGFANYGPDAVQVYDATIVRLREVTLGYTLPKSVLGRTPFGRASVSVTGRNLWFRSPNFPEGSNYDPEISSLGSGNAQGIDLGGAIAARRIGINLSLTF